LEDQKVIEELKSRNKELQDAKRAILNVLEDFAEQKTELEKVNKELDGFVHIVSHDLRTPLRGISSFITFLEEDYKDKLGKEGQEFIDEIRNGADRLGDLIDDLLTLSRISRIKNPYETVDIQALIDSVLESIKHDIKTHRVGLKIHDQLPTVVCDRVKMAQVFLNLINNGIKFSSKNNRECPKIEIGFTERSDSFEFYVKDNGIGIDPQYHEQIFGVFRRLHTEKEFEGTGVGLSIVKKVIDDHGGRIWIESQLGQGACFYFTVPKGLERRVK